MREFKGDFYPILFGNTVWCLVCEARGVILPDKSTCAICSGVGILPIPLTEFEQ